MLILLFLLVWIIFNGQITLEIVLFGLGIGILMYIFVCAFMGYKPSTDIMIIRLIPAGLWYVIVLVSEIIKANISVVKYIGTSKYDLLPVVVSFDVPLETNFARVILANSITLTPGTITCKLEGNHLEVHCLDEELAAGLDSSVFVELLTKIEKMALKK